MGSAIPLRPHRIPWGNDRCVMGFAIKRRTSLAFRRPGASAEATVEFAPTAAVEVSALAGRACPRLGATGQAATCFRQRMPDIGGTPLLP